MVTEDIPAPQVGGLGKHVVTLANALIAAGHEVALLGRSDVDYEACRAEIGFNGRFIPGFSLQRAGWKETQLGVWMPNKRPSLAARIEQSISAHASGFDVIHYHGHLPMVGLTLPASLPFLQTRHDQGSECLTHVRFVRGDVCSALDPAVCAQCATPQPNALQKWVSSLAVNQYRDQVRRNFASRQTIFVSDFLRQQFLRAVPSADLARAAVVHNFIDLARLRRHAGDVQPQQGLVVLAGRIDASKGFAAFFDAWEAAGSPGVPHVVGEGPLREMLEARFGKLAHFHGWQPYGETVAKTAAAHICVVPSLWQEPCGTTVLEALTLGRPCFALARGGTPELRRYERYPGQLQLATDMPGLLQLVKVALETPPVCLPLPASFEADVGATLERILAIYRRACHPLDEALISA
jgi:glycosyltransferase involved in cell wall biosynthesis